MAANADARPDPAEATSVDADDAEWEDLTRRRAGTALREEARACRARQPVTSRLLRLMGVHTAERAWRVGAQGEVLVAGQLWKLRKRGWGYVHSVPVGDRGSDIDHVVWGPGGVFTLNTKHHPKARLWVGGDTFMVNGQRQPYVRNSRFEARRAAKLLSQAAGVDVPVTAVIVPVNAASLVIKTPPRDVHVVNRAALVKWLRSRPAVLTRDQVKAISAVATRSTTWTRT